MKSDCCVKSDMINVYDTTSQAKPAGIRYFFVDRFKFKIKEQDSSSFLLSYIG